MMKHHPRTLAGLAIGLAALATAAPAEAASHTRDVTVRVRYKPHELASLAGAQSLYGRIAAAARRGCRGHGIEAMLGRTAAQACRVEVVDRIVAQAASPILAAVHEGRTPVRT